MNFSLFIYLFNTFFVELCFQSGIVAFFYCKELSTTVIYILLFVWTDYFPRWWLGVSNEQAPIWLYLPYIRDVACFQTKAIFINTTRKKQDARSTNKIQDCLIGTLELQLDGEKL